MRVCVCVLVDTSVSALNSLLNVSFVCVCLCVCRHIRECVADSLSAAFLEVYNFLTKEETAVKEYSCKPQDVGRRRLRNSCLAYLAG